MPEDEAQLVRAVQVMRDTWRRVRGRSRDSQALRRFVEALRELDADLAAGLPLLRGSGPEVWVALGQLAELVREVDAHCA